MFENEEWREVEGLEHYRVSDHGRVKRVDGVDARKVIVSDAGFPVLTLYGKDKKTRYLRQVNQLVAKAFLNPPFYANETAVWHIDGDLTNCRADNLLWEKRSLVLEWNDMHRPGYIKRTTPRVKNNRTGAVYPNAYEAGLAEGETESKILWRIERQASHTEDDNAHFRYVD